MKTSNVSVRANSFCDIHEFNANSGPENNADKIQVWVFENVLTNNLCPRNLVANELLHVKTFLH